MPHSEPAPQPAPQQPAYTEPQQPVYQPTQQMPQSYQQPQQGYMPPQQGYAVPMTQPVPGPGQTGSMGRTIDVKPAKSPKWPIVLIVMLLLLIAAAVALILWRPWAGGANDGTAVISGGNVVVTSEPATQPVGAPAGGEVVVLGNDTGTPQATPTAPAAPSSDEQVHAQLTSAYDQFDGFAARIGTVVDFFNSYYPDTVDAATLQAQLASAQALQGELATQAATLNAIVLPEGSAYVQALANMKTLNNDLVVRIGDLADALSAWIAGDMDAAAAALIRHNENGASVYKTEYEALYPNARP